MAASEAVGVAPPTDSTFVGGSDAFAIKVDARTAQPWFMAPSSDHWQDDAYATRVEHVLIYMM